MSDHYKGKSVEQVAEEYARSIRETRGKILDDFHQAYAAQLSKNGAIDLESVCLVEQRYWEGATMCTKFWFEYKPMVKT